jgi:hypothetical protein
MGFPLSFEFFILCTKFKVMIIYNVTVKIEHDAHVAWLSWMREVHVPEVLATGLFLDSQMARVMVDEEDGVTYAIQYRCADMSTLERYQRDHAPRLQAGHSEKFKDKFVAFRTILEVV